MAQCPRLRPIGQFTQLLLSLLLVVSLSYSVTQALADDRLPSGSSLEHVYSVDVSCRYTNVSSHFAGTQVLKLQRLDMNSLSGRVSWNLSWDEGATWYAVNTTYSYTANRTYRNQNVTLFTAWWIDPAVQLGDRLTIHGDPPATDYFLRDGPFVVTDVVSLPLNLGVFTCWLLTYETLGGQQERFYYERWTGLLVAAYSSRTDSLPRSRQMRLELQTATPPLPQEDLLTHLWLTIGPPLLSFAIAVFAAAGTYRVLFRLRGRRFKEWSEQESEHTNHKNERKRVQTRPAKESAV